MSDPDSSVVFYILLLFLLILVNAFFAMSELALITLNDAKIRRMAQDGDKRAAAILKLTGQPSKFLAAIQVGVTLSGFLASAVAADTFTEYVIAAFAHTAIPLNVLRVISLIVITFLLSFFTLVLGELVPKRVAMQHYEKIAFAVTPVLWVLMAAEKPFVWLLSVSTNGVLRLIGIDPNQKPEEVTEEEIRMMIDVGSESGTIENQEKDMINNIFEFDDRSAAEIMTHRTDVESIEITATLEEIVALATKTGYSRIPVYEDDLDNIIGVLYGKDLLDFITQPAADFKLRQYMREPLYVLESTSCKKLLALLQEKKIQMAVVVDEYGGTAGIVTMEDILESIVGNIQDEYDDEEEEITQISENLYLIEGTTPLEDVERYFDLECEEDEDFDTIGGYLIYRTGRIPGELEHPSLTIGDIRLTVLEMDDRRVDKIEARRIAPEEQETID
ncbi:MAG: hemolysin family protein [Oscillospiraceae bacterium]|nr:hemolysin family protein [Oscillospiraceae bacterium]